MDWYRSALRVYRGLLLTYPSEFRHEYGGQMEQLFAIRLRQEPWLLLWLHILCDIALSAPVEHFHLLRGDLRHAVRQLRTTPAFTFAALLTLTFGIGVTTTVFSLFNAVLLRSLPYGDPSRLVYLWTPLPSIKQLPREIAPPWADVIDWRRLSTSFAGVTALQIHTAVLQGGNSVRIQSARVLGNFFQTLQATPELGRGLTPADDSPGHSQVVVISDALWHSHFSADPAVLDKTLRIDGREYRVVGVMPREFGFPHATDLPLASPTLHVTEVWMPAALTQLQQSDRVSLTDEPDVVIARLRPNISLSHAQAEMSAIEARLAPLYTPEWRALTCLVTPFLQTVLEPVRSEMNLMMAAVGLVLLIACVNLANLLLVRGSERVHEFGVRTALGAERSRLVRQMLTESVLLSTVGGALGTLAGFVSLHLVTRMNPGDIPRFDEISVDARVLSFGLAVSLATGLLAGVYPALAASSLQVTELLRHGGRGIAGISSRTRPLFVIAEVAIAVVLLVCGGLLLRSYRILEAQDQGFAPSTITMTFTDAGEPDPPPVATAAVLALERHLVSRHKALLKTLRSLPAIVAGGLVDDLPLSHSEDIDMFQLEGQPESLKQSANIRHISAGYFEAMQIRLLAGRVFTDADIENDPSALPSAVVVTRSFAREHFHERSPVGQRLRFRKERWSTIVGVVGDVRHSSLEQTPQATVYWPSWLGGTIVVRSAGPAAHVIASIRKEIARQNPGSAITDVKTMSDYIAEASARRKFQAVMLTVFSSIAVFLAMIGLYGLLSYAVRQRTAEIGVRIAVGASRTAVLTLILRDGLGLTGAGLTLGLVLALGASRGLSGLLYGVTATDPLTFATVPALLLAVAILACLLPAWKAAQTDPIQALRAE